MKALLRQSFSLIGVVFLIFSQNVQANLCQKAFSSKYATRHFNYKEYLQTKKYYERNLARIAHENESQRGMFLLPPSVEGKIAIIESLANYQIKDLSFFYPVEFKLNSKRIKKLTPLIKKIRRQKTLTTEDLFEVLLKYHDIESYSYFEKNDWKVLFKTNRKEAQNLLLKVFVIGLLSEHISIKLNTPEKALTKKVMAQTLKSLSWLIAPRIPDFSAPNYKKTKEKLNAVSDLLTQKSAREAYLQFEKLYLRKTQQSIYFKWIRKISHTAMAVLISVTMLYHFDTHVFPIEGFYTSRDAILSEILHNVNQEYYKNHGRYLNKEELNFYREGFNEVSKWQLLYESRSYK